MRIGSNNLAISEWQVHKNVCPDIGHVGNAVGSHVAKPDGLVQMHGVLQFAVAAQK
jgi:hypothetical protein